MVCVQGRSKCLRREGDTICTKTRLWLIHCYLIPYFYCHEQIIFQAKNTDYSPNKDHIVGCRVNINDYSCNTNCLLIIL